MLKNTSSGRLLDLGEDEVVRVLTADLPKDGSVVVGPGDDCAVLEYGRTGYYQLFKTDCLVQGVHYTPETPARLVGRKALARAMSDVAAMGGWPTQALVTLALSPQFQISYLRELYDGLTGVAREFGVSVVGGETSRLPVSSGKAAVINVSLLGLVERERCVTRAGAKVGEVIFVTGTLGGSIRGKHLNFQPRVWEGRWLSEHFRPTSMMDLSDGLAKDLPRLSAMSDLGFQVVMSRLPRSPGCDETQAINDGEDYELLFTISADRADDLRQGWARTFPDLPLTQIGWMCPKDQSMAPHWSAGGWDHFQPSVANL